jgi:type II secretory pathway pseudopilin PulG
MEVGIVGLVIAVVSGLASFALGRWLSKRRRQKKAEQARTVAEAGQSRQVRRARERQRRR